MLLALITGASSGIGLATARVLARQGARVCITGRNETALRSLVDEIGGSAGYVVGDLTEPGFCKHVVTEAAEQMGGLTTLVNCAGVLQGGAFGSEACNLENFKFNFNHNTLTVFEMMEHAIPHLKQAAASANDEMPRKTTAIVNVSSTNGKQSFGACATYCASKAAVDMLTRCASVDLAPYGIRVNSVNPGVVVTELQKRGGLGDEAYLDFLQRSIAVTHPIAGFRDMVGQPEEVGELIAFLASGKAGFITGECIAIDGGRQNLGAR